ncbi:Lrp/AsnC family leucine-responsive transcriptional regulator [Angulomicrobium tetraedrale]|uniref:Lrp/AsnC family leucine-responsive transcriptional regulator n=1 Tax=Ancylobacter tetraedralis TaxID=217068 RepID=A0A839ZEV0_9HYPH|nr:Lrp/AsnC family transcriptional regulator [Ancylobacter tetraedralis]MBB3773177.1 Lrp/AsnC family leucine-responsive transcriptional regulator [Ancylobacter tetraedralis]
MRPPVLDMFDLRILRELQEDGRLTNAELSERIGLSPSPCLRRTRRLEEEGLIAGYQARLGAPRLGLGVLAFIQVHLERQVDAAARDFEAAVLALPQVIACYSVTGDSDYLLHVVCEDLEGFAHFAHDILMGLPGVRGVRSSLALKRVKESQRLPLDHLRAVPASPDSAAEKLGNDSHGSKRRP